MLENTLGDEVVWSYADVGAWNASCTLFSPTNTIATAMGTNGSFIVIADTINMGEGLMQLWQYSPEDGQQFNNFSGWIEIRVYN